MITTPTHRAADDAPVVPTNRAADDLPRDLALLPLRAFLGITYAYAGLQKLANATYLDPNAPGGVAAQMRAAVHMSPIEGLLGTASHHAAAVGLLIAFGELAVGIGTLLGLWTRAAAVGGMALALSFLLAVSWHSNPYYLGPDIVFLAAFTPLALAPPSRWSIDTWVSRRVRSSRTSAAPALADERRRRFLETLSVAGWVGLVGLGVGGSAAALGRLFGARADGSAVGTTKLQPPRPSPTAPNPSAPNPITPNPSAPNPSAPTTSTPTTSTTSPGTAIGRAADVPVGRSAQFADPATGASSIVVQPRAGVYEGCSAICTHEGCTVEYRNNVLHCPCHGAEFDPATGAVLQGPANQPLATLTIRSNRDGNLYLIG